MNKLLEKSTNEELQKLWNAIFYMDFMNDCDGFVDRIITDFENEIKKRIENGTMEKPSLMGYPSDYALWVNNLF